MHSDTPRDLAVDAVPAPLCIRSIDDATLAVSGEIDAATAADLAAHLTAGVTRVVLSAVTFIDAAGLAVLLTAQHARPHGLTLCSPSRPVLRLLDLAGHRSTFPVSMSRDESDDAPTTVDRDRR